MNIEIPAHVACLLKKLNKSGFEAFVVGGCVRDAALGLVPHDWDICTSARPDAVKHCFLDERVIDVGIRHGTVVVLSGGIPVEITTYRVDGTYQDHRRPDSVCFTKTLTEDLARRDFTINAMAYHPVIGVVDPFDGLSDLRKSLLRCVGDARERFLEDALRILRGIRFASTYQLRMEAKTEEALFANRALLRFVSKERILQELTGMRFSKVDRRLLPVFQEIIPELREIDVDDLPRVPELQFAALLKGLDAGAILRRLKASNALAQRVSVLVSHWDFTALDAVSMRYLLHDIGIEAAEQLFVLQKNDSAARVLREVIAREDCYSLHSLHVNGHDLQQIGFSGKAIGEALKVLLRRVMDGTLENDHRALLEAALSMV